MSKQKRNTLHSAENQEEMLTMIFFLEIHVTLPSKEFSCAERFMHGSEMSLYASSLYQSPTSTQQQELLVIKRLHSTSNLRLSMMEVREAILHKDAELKQSLGHVGCIK